MSGLVSVVRNEENYTTAYACQQLVQYNKLTPVDIVFYYDLAYQGDFNASLALIESNLLEQVATVFGIKDGKRCLNPPVGTIWLAAISSTPIDVIDSNYQHCLSLPTNSTERCVVVRGGMNGSAVNPSSDNSFIVTEIAQAMRTGAATKGTSDRVAFLGTNLDNSALGSGGDALPSAVARDQSGSSDSGGRSITVLGGFLVAGFCFLLLGVFYFLYQRRKRYETTRDVELALSKSDSMAEKDDVPTLHHDALSDDMADGNDATHSLNGSNGSHAPDLGQSLRNEMMGVHARHTDYMNTRAMDDVSDAGSGSDADSWAQTDGTIGSLELQLEPITAEV